MLSSRRWPADESRPVAPQGTPTKKNDSIHSDGSVQSELLGLDMSGSKIKTLTPVICRFTFLTELRLSNNFINRLPPGIGQLRSLAYLDLSNNQITDLPSEMGWLSNLKELLLFGNHIQDLPGEMGYLYQLENLGIEGNPINENLMQIVHSQGPLAIVPFLRDHMISTLIGDICNFSYCATR
jgi:CCR4-NOT transcription complex subunit 6